MFERIKEIVEIQNETLMKGLELGRSESEARIKKLEADNATLLEALKAMLVMSETTQDTRRRHVSKN